MNIQMQFAYVQLDIIMNKKKVLNNANLAINQPRKNRRSKNIDPKTTLITSFDALVIRRQQMKILTIRKFPVTFSFFILSLSRKKRT